MSLSNKLSPSADLFYQAKTQVNEICNRLPDGTPQSEDVKKLAAAILNLIYAIELAQ